jgi:acetylglutamate kinase
MTGDPTARRDKGANQFVCIVFPPIDGNQIRQRYPRSSKPIAKQMKVVIKIASFLANSSDYTMRLARAASSLFQDAHSLALVHGAHREADADPIELRVGCAWTFSDSAVAAIGKETRSLVASLRSAGSSALGICGGDGGLCEVRKKHLPGGRAAVEVTHVNPHWIDVICANRGIPVISNLVLAPWGEHYLVDSDQLAAACARYWAADALIYLTSVDGVRDLNGAIIRWLDVDHIEFLKNQSALNQGMLFKLNACKQALECGVRRVRILPASHVDALPSFFFSRIDHGTEVIAAGR